MGWTTLEVVPVRMLLLGALAGFALILSSCGFGTASSCSISNNLSPATATADHNMASPGNQAKFLLSSQVSGTCPMVADFQGSWSTSDPVDISLLTINAQFPNNITATCLGATSGAATISNSSTIRGKPFPPAKLICN